MTNPKEAREWLSEYMRIAKGEAVPGVPAGSVSAEQCLRDVQKSAEHHRRNLMEMRRNPRWPAKKLADYTRTVDRLYGAIPKLWKLADAQARREKQTQFARTR